MDERRGTVNVNLGILCNMQELASRQVHWDKKISICKVTKHCIFAWTYRELNVEDSKLSLCKRTVPKRKCGAASDLSESLQMLSGLGTEEYCSHQHYIRVSGRPRVTLSYRVQVILFG